MAQNLVFKAGLTVPCDVSWGCLGFKTVPSDVMGEVRFSGQFLGMSGEGCQGFRTVPGDVRRDVRVSRKLQVMSRGDVRVSGQFQVMSGTDVRVSGQFQVMFSDSSM